MNWRARLEAFPTQLLLTVAWVVMVPVAVITRWLWSIAFISAVSIYANAASHWGAHRAWKAERAAAGGNAPPTVSHDMPPRPSIDSPPLDAQRLWRDRTVDYAAPDDGPGLYL